MIHSTPVQFGQEKKWQKVALRGLYTTATLGMATFAYQGFTGQDLRTMAREYRKAREEKVQTADKARRQAEIAVRNASLNTLRQCEIANEELNGPQVRDYFQRNIASTPQVTVISDTKYPKVRLNNREYTFYLSHNGITLLTSTEKSGKTSLYAIETGTQDSNPTGQEYKPEKTATLEFPPEDFTPAQALPEECKKESHLPNTMTFRKPENVAVVSGFLDNLNEAIQKLQKEGIPVNLNSGGKNPKK